MLKNLFLNCICMLLCYTLVAKQSTHEVFTSYQLVNNPITTNVYSGQNITIDLGNLGNYNINLLEQNYFSENYNRINPSKHFSGTITDFPDAKISLTINDNFVMGFIQLENEKIFIEPASLFEDLETSNELIVYSENDVIAVETNCAQQYLVENQNRLMQNNEFNNASAACDSYVIEVATLVDNSVYTAFGMQQTTLRNYFEGINNMSQVYYDNQFAKKINLLLVETVIETSANQFNITNSLDAGLIIDDIEKEQDEIFTKYFDVATFWTTRDIEYQNDSGVAGLAIRGSICKSFSITVNEMYISNTASLVKLNVHEIGHIVGAGHDGDGENYIMAPNGSGDTWSANSVNQINNKLENEVCQCVNGAFVDLRVSCPQIITTSIGNTNYILLNGSVANRGNVASSQTVYKAYISADETASADDTEILSMPIPSLVAGAAMSYSNQFINLSYITSTMPNGTYNLIVHIDSADDEPSIENNTSSNCRTIEVTNGIGPVYYINNVFTQGTSFTPGQLVTLTWEDNIPFYNDMRVSLVSNSKNYRKQLTTLTGSSNQVLIYIPFEFNPSEDYYFELAYYQNNILKTIGKSNNFAIESKYTLANLELSSNDYIAGDQVEITWDDDIADTEKLHTYLYRDERYFVKTIESDISATGIGTFTLPDGLGEASNYNLRLVYWENGDDVAWATSLTFNIKGSLKLSNEFNPVEMNIMPNPVHYSTTISLNVEKAKNVNINLYSVSGELVETIINNTIVNAGYHLYNLDMSTYAAGIYYCSILVDDKITTKKIIKVKQ